MSNVIVKIEHCRKLLYCSRGIRDLFARCGLNYSDFLVNGIDAQTLLEASNYDAMVEAVVEVASGEE